MRYARARANKLCIDSIWNFAIYYEYGAQQQQKIKVNCFAVVDVSVTGAVNFLQKNINIKMYVLYMVLIESLRHIRSACERARESEIRFFLLSWVSDGVNTAPSQYQTWWICKLIQIRFI